MQKLVHITIFLRLLLATFFFIPLCVLSQPKAKKTRILFLLDASSSMTYQWNSGYTRFEVASNVLLKIMDSVYSINNEVEFAVRAYGTMYPAQLVNCVDTKLEVPFNLQNTNQIKTRLKYLKPIGSSPIAFSLKEASENELNAVDKYDYSVIFITDGGESCGGDVCGVYQKLLEKKISIKPYIIGLDRNDNLKTYYACLGNYIDVSTPEDIDKAVQLIIEANRSIIEKPKQLKLVTTYSKTPVIKDTVKPVVVVKKDTVIPKPISVNGDFLQVQKMKWLESPAIKLKTSAYKFPKSKKAVLHFAMAETIKERDKPLIDLMDIGAGRISKSASKTNLIAKKSSLKLPKKASLKFEFEETKKSSPVFASLTPAIVPLTVKSTTKMVAKKSTLKLAKKAILSFEYEEPKKMSPVLTSLQPKFKKIELRTSKAELIGVSKLKFSKKVSLKFEVDVPKRDTIAFLRYVKYPKFYSYANKLPDTRKMAAVMNGFKKQKAVLRFKVEEKKVAVKKDTIAATSPIEVPNNSVDFTMNVVATKETAVQVYFNNPNGKTYPNASPLILIQDVATSSTVTQFNRTTSAGEPVPQKVSPGKYNLVVKGFDDLYVNNIVINPNTTTKIIIKVNDGTLQFRYKSNIKRPVKEYSAHVVRRFAGTNSAVDQKCSETRMYEPGTYFMEVNCLPPYKASIDLTFDALYEIQIEEPGTLAIMNSEPLGKVQLQCLLGDQYVTFYTMNVTGKLSEQRVELLSGKPYKAIYPADPRMPQAGNKEVPFTVNPDNILELELK